MELENWVDEFGPLIATGLLLHNGCVFIAGVFR